MKELITQFDGYVKTPLEATYPERSIMWIIQRWVDKHNMYFKNTAVVNCRVESDFHKKIFEPVVGYWLAYTKESTANYGGIWSKYKIGCGVYKGTKYDLNDFSFYLQLSYYPDILPTIIVRMQKGRNKYLYYGREVLYKATGPITISNCESVHKNTELFWDFEKADSLIDRETEKGPVLLHFRVADAYPYTYNEYRLTRFKSDAFRAERKGSYNRFSAYRWTRCPLNKWLESYIEFIKNDRIRKWFVEPNENIIMEAKMQATIGEL